MKKNTITTTILGLALAASVGTNIYQSTYEKGDVPQIRTDYETDEPADVPATVEPGETTPPATDAETRLYAVTTTYAITYKVDEKAGPGGATITIAHVDHAAPRFLRTAKKPGVKDVPETWAPDLSIWENVIKVEVKSVEAKLLKRQPG